MTITTSSTPHALCEQHHDLWDYIMLSRLCYHSHHTSAKASNTFSTPHKLQFNHNASQRRRIFSERPHRGSEHCSRQLWRRTYSAAFNCSLNHELTLSQASAQPQHAKTNVAPAPELEKGAGTSPNPQTQDHILTIAIALEGLNASGGGNKADQAEPTVAGDAPQKQ